MTAYELFEAWWLSFEEDSRPDWEDSLAAYLAGHCDGYDSALEDMNAGRV